MKPGDFHQIFVRKVKADMGNDSINNFNTFETDRITSGFDIFFWEFDDKNSYVPTHWHKAIEIMYIMDGSVSVILKDQTITLLPGDVYLIDSIIPHSTISVHGNKAILIQLPYSLLEKYIPDIDTLNFSFDCHSANSALNTKMMQLIEVIKQMQIIFHAKPDGCALRFNSLVFELLFQLYHNFRRTMPEKLLQKKEQNFNRLDVVLKYTDEHYQENITLSEISGIACFEERYFCHFFKKNMGITYFQYLNKLRLSHILHDLLSTDLPLKILLEKHGFTNYKLFRKMFFEEFQTTPNEYRKMQLSVSSKRS